MPALEPRIRLLDPHTVNQIAAGEVVERPAAALKELVENALDAGAARIEVDLEEAGRRLIRVRDDGCGMSEADALASLQRHATSKIRAIGDLLSVETLGFRGEALPSIASVSRMTLSTGDQDGVRTVVRVDAGRAAPAVREPGPRGTELLVEDLFHNTPARLKFLKTDTTELAACVEVVQRAAVGRPDVSFLLRHNGQEMMRSHGDGDLLEAIASVWGRDIARALVPLDSFNGSVRVRGFVSPPHFTRPTRAFQWVFVNGRPVRSRQLTAALDVAYRSLTPEKRYPVAVLMLDVEPAKVDVNVSPTKSEVKFQQEGAVFDSIRHAIRSALLTQGMIPSAESLAAANEAIAQSQPASSFFPQAPGNWEQQLAMSLLANAPLPMEWPQSVGAPPPSPRAMDQLLDGLVVIGQLMSTFILAENRRGLLIVDQHVAHERILFERLRDRRGEVPVERQVLLAPETLQLDRRSAELLSERIEDLQSVGFDVDSFGGDTFLVRAVPAALRGKNPLQVLRELADEMIESCGAGRLTPGREAIWITCACRMAVKAGDALAKSEMEKLLYDLAETENPYLCPHGRPITIVFDRSELLRKFKRT